MLECIPYYEPGDRITVEAREALIAKRFCKLAASGEKLNGKVLPAELADASADVLIGVVGFDQPDVGSTTVAYSMGVGYYVPITASVALAPGDLVSVAADGKAGKAADATTAVGRCFNTAAVDADAFVRLSI
jgi:hypothetical protein